jgi:hypothetical protein
MQAQDTRILDEAPVYAPRPYVPFQPPAHAGSPPRDSSQCGYLQAERDRIDARMRQGVIGSVVENGHRVLAAEPAGSGDAHASVRFNIQQSTSSVPSHNLWDTDQ